MFGTSQAFEMKMAEMEEGEVKKFADELLNSGGIDKQYLEFGDDN